MARLYTGKHGKSKSRKPIVDSATFGSGNEELSKEQIEKIIIDYAKSGMSPALIGETLKTKHNVKYIKQAIGMRLLEFLSEKKLNGEIPSDMIDLIRKAITMRKHIEKNKQDVYGKIRLIRIESKIWRLVKYYRRIGSIPENWKYDPSTAELLIKNR